MAALSFNDHDDEFEDEEEEEGKSIEYIKTNCKNQLFNTLAIIIMPKHVASGRAHRHYLAPG